MTTETPTLSPTLAAWLDARATELDVIEASRRGELDELAVHLRSVLDAGREPHALFVCTHNSRRSQMAQLLASAAAAREGVTLHTHSAGTEETAFDPRAVAAVERAGFLVETVREGANPLYAVRLAAGAEPIHCSSKRIDDATPDDTPFAAVMVCDSADAACPFVPGAAWRAPITYVDPKLSDDTPEEAATYDERCRQIGREMLYLAQRTQG